MLVWDNNRQPDMVKSLLLISLESLGVSINPFMTKKNYYEDHSSCIDLYISIARYVDMGDDKDSIEKIVSRIRTYVPDVFITCEDFIDGNYNPDSFAKIIKYIMKYIYKEDADDVSIKYIIRDDYCWTHDNTEEVYNRYTKILDIAKYDNFLTC